MDEQMYVTMPNMIVTSPYPKQKITITLLILVHF